MNTATRYIPSSYKLLKETPHTAVYGGEIKPGRFAAMGFIRTSKNPSFHYGFPRLSDMEGHIESFTKTVESNLEARAKSVIARKARLAAEIAAVKVGDLFSYSWGYEQTNVEFFQVIEKKAKSFVIREIHSKTLSNETGNSMSAYVTPEPNKFLMHAEATLKTSFNMPHGVLSKTEAGQKHYSSWYA